MRDTRGNFREKKENGYREMCVEEIARRVSEEEREIQRDNCLPLAYHAKPKINETVRG